MSDFLVWKEGTTGSLHAEDQYDNSYSVSPKGLGVYELVAGVGGLYTYPRGKRTELILKAEEMYEFYHYVMRESKRLGIPDLEWKYHQHPKYGWGSYAEGAIGTYETLDDHPRFYQTLLIHRRMLTEQPNDAREQLMFGTNEAMKAADFHNRSVIVQAMAFMDKVTEKENA